MSSKEPQKRVIVYIDGYNLYYGLCEQGWRKYLWLNLEGLADSLLLENQTLKAVKYFTTRISHPYEKKQRQNAYIDAITNLSKVAIFYGKFHPDEVTCERCKAIVPYLVEKKTDVNISTEMLMDAIDGEFDSAILISGDSDQEPTICHIRSKCPRLPVVVAFPPKRESYELERVATSAYRIVKAKFRENQLPEKITLPSGSIVERPSEWTKKSN